jgi:hypothetical protein
MNDLSQFRQYYNQHLHADLVNFDRRRRRLVLLILFSLGFGIGLTIYVLVLGIVALIFFLIIPWFSIWWLIRQQVKHFKEDYKPMVVQSILRFIDPRYRYYHKEYISLDTFVRSGIFPFVPKFYHGEDYITGKIGEVFFEMCELKVSHVMGFKQKLEHIFGGVFFHANFNTPFKGRIVILPREGWQTFVATMKDFSRYGGYEVKGIGSEAFQEDFIVYTDQDVVYKQVLNEHLIATIYNYYSKSKKKVYVSFVNSHFFFGIEEPRQVLEAHIFSANIDFKLLRSFYEELVLFTRLVTDFDLEH